MTEQDAFFTQTIVGPPMTVILGRRATGADGAGLEIDPHTGDARLSPAWQPWVLQRLSEWPAGVPMGRPGAVRRALERHALLIAGLGLVALTAGLVMLVLAGSKLW